MSRKEEGMMARREGRAEGRISRKGRREDIKEGYGR
jgi:hypothetical protein